MILIEDDASRMLVGFGAFKNATAENSARILKEAIERYGAPKQIMIDRGVQFVSLPREDCPWEKTTWFYNFKGLQMSLDKYHLRVNTKLSWIK